MEKRISKILMKENNILRISVIFTLALLNHTNRDYGINMSMSDIFILVSLFLMIFDFGIFKVNVDHIFIFLVLSIYLLSISIFITPNMFNINMNVTHILLDFLKLLVVFIYFIYGYNLGINQLLDVAIKSYSIGALLIASISIIFKIFNITKFNQILYFSKSRLRGLMIDPNYFAIIQCSSLAYFIRKKDLNIFFKFLLVSLYFMIIFMTGSKTGLIISLIYIVLFIVEKGISYPVKIFNYIFIFITSIIKVYFIREKVNNILNIVFNNLLRFIPIVKRFELLLSSFSLSISGGGSGRNLTWNNAINIFKLSPILGIGLGSYLPISKKMFNSSSLAHNSYLQTFVEWGGVWGALFWSYIFITVIKVSILAYKTGSNRLLIIRDIIIVMLLGSISISLNNARMFWLFLGGVLSEISTINKNKYRKD